MKLQQAKDFYELGVITSINALEAPYPLGWKLSFLIKDGRRMMLETALGREKTFASFDTLIGEVQEITGKNVKSLQLNLA